MLWLVNVFFSNTALQIHGHNKILICHFEIFWFAILKFSLQNKQTDYLFYTLDNTVEVLRDLYWRCLADWRANNIYQLDT